MSQSDRAHRCLQLGHAARRAGRAAEALRHYEAAVGEDPQGAEAHSVYGLMLLELGRAGEAESPLRKAVEIAPSHPALQMNLARWLAHQGRAEEAAQLVEQLVRVDARHWWAWDRLGDLKSQLGNHAEAADCFGRASALRPLDAALLFKQAQSLRDCGREAEAIRVQATAARLAQPRLDALRPQAAQQEARGQWTALERTAREWIAVQPRDPEAWRSLATAQSETGRFGRAMETFGHALTFGARDARSLATYARLGMSALDYDAAAKALDEAEALDPASASVLAAKADLLMVSGRHDEAITCCRRALAQDPGDVGSYRTLVRLTAGALSPAEFAQLETLAGHDGARASDRVDAAFAIADCRDAQEAADAFAAYDRANALAREAGRAEGIAYDPAARVARTDELIALFGTVSAQPAPAAGPRIVFIVGMPRSGTTLIESVIGAHSRVLACGERLAMRWILEDFLSHARAGAVPRDDSGAWDEWRRRYREDIPADGAAAAVTDKNPWNFDAIGLITRLFPGAAIVHVRRNPLDTGLSIYRNRFSRSLQFTNRLEDIGHYHGEYARLMAHWDRVAAGRFVTVQYEEFVRDFDTAGPALLAACGLEWEPACARFWESRRVIATMSTMQARQPLAVRPAGGGKYADCLEPLEASLAAAGVDLATGALRTPG